MPTTEHCVIFVPILGKKVHIYFFYEWTVTTVVDGYLRYVAENFQRLQEFGRVGYINLMDDQGLFKEHEGDAKEHEGDAKEGQGCSKNDRQLLRSASILLP